MYSNLKVTIQKSKPRSGGKSIAVGEASAIGASKTHGLAIPQFLCAMQHSTAERHGAEKLAACANMLPF